MPKIPPRPTKRLHIADQWDIEYAAMKTSELLAQLAEKAQSVSALINISRETFQVLTQADCCAIAKSARESNAIALEIERRAMLGEEIK